jgi:hypothetical protein
MTSMKRNVGLVLLFYIDNHLSGIGHALMRYTGTWHVVGLDLLPSPNTASLENLCLKSRERIEYKL